MNDGFGIIYTDPPWKQTKGGTRKCRPRQGKALDYPTLGLTEIFSIQKHFFNLAAEKHNVFMWTIDKFLFDAEAEMKRMGYALHARFIWDKENGIAPAFTVRFSHEYLLWFYKKGRILLPRSEIRGKYTTVMRERSTKHSKKPECAYLMLEDMFPDARKIELFARNTRPGWESWGNEV